LGIPEAGVEDWEDEDEDDGDDNRLESAPAKEQDAVKEVEPIKEFPKPRLVGLRPGGSSKQ
jgi:hypothetical protein